MFLNLLKALESIQKHTISAPLEIYSHTNKFNTKEIKHFDTTITVNCHAQGLIYMSCLHISHRLWLKGDMWGG